MIYERDNPLSFCAILLVLSMAFADRAYESEHIRQPRDLYDLTIPDTCVSLPIWWKDQCLDQPVFRCTSRVHGKVMMSPTKAIPYSKIAKQVQHLGRAAGLRQNLTTYSFCRGAANLLDSKVTWQASNVSCRSLYTDSTIPDMRGFVIGHVNPSKFERHYRNNVV